MESERQNNTWQVEVGGVIYDASLAELPKWIDEGSLRPNDRVRRGNLRWIQAAKVPSLTPYFNARDRGERVSLNEVSTGGVPIQPATTHEARPAEPKVGVPDSHPTVAAEVADSTVFSTLRLSATGECRAHPGLASDFICSGCGGEFCRACPRSYGGTVKICPKCGSMCRSKKDAGRFGQANASVEQFSDEPFGFADLKRAIAHPFKFKPSLVFGGLMFMLFTLGQSVSAFGGIMFLLGALFCGMLANMLTFGILANTVENFTQGRVNADFMPNYDDFSLWGDVIHPFLLSIGVYLSSFGPFILIAAGGMFLLMDAAGAEAKMYDDELARLPGTQHYTPNRTAEQSKEVKQLLEQVNLANQRRLARQQRLAEAADSGTLPTGRDLDSFSTETVETNDSVPAGDAPVIEDGTLIGSTSGTEDTRFRGTVSGILRLAAPLVVLGTLALLWGLFYFPAACAVAAYSRSFIATINPLVGLDTIKRLGPTYFKLLLMGLLILILSGVVAMGMQLILFPFNLPAIGNLPATAVTSIFTFYFSIVFSCLLGYGLLKSADRLKLYR